MFKIRSKQTEINGAAIRNRERKEQRQNIKGGG